ncbi:MAG TPA: 4Fe-4S dicluster domain-containing protein [Ignavibacteriaceae bacterium]|nr:4Fe-4S dicluster domain-containing protein [Ignavibacteriaceae bacterium]
MIVNKNDFHSFLKKVNNGLGNFSEVIVPYRARSDDEKPAFHFLRFEEGNSLNLNFFRTVDPLKILFYLTREKVYPLKQKIHTRAIVGVKACDLKALHLLDKAMLQNGFVDPAYKIWRDNTLIVSSDCDHLHETCSCNLVNGHPYSDNGFDLNLSVIDGNYYIEIGSERCQDFVELMKKEISVGNSTASDQELVKSKRQKVFDQLCKKNDYLEHSGDYSGFRKVIHKNWEEASKECVGCGACTNICPTCYCLILNDESTEKEFVKVRSYDSCQWHGYARVAGGGTPRPKMTERFRNRYLCKFDYMHKNFGEIGCTGCGRCTEACAAKIDFREVVKNVSALAQEVN